MQSHQPLEKKDYQMMGKDVTKEPYKRENKAEIQTKIR